MIVTRSLPSEPLAAWVAEFERLAMAGRSLPTPVAKSVKHDARKRSANCCLILSPHPDDECIVGGLPLRLMRESGWRVVNLAVTHGSRPERQLARASELQAACKVLGFENIFLQERGLLRISEHSRGHEPVHWAACVAQVAQHINSLRPDLLLCPHPQDAQAAHIGTHLLTLDALAAMPPGYSPLVALTEYWSTMASPNLMLQISSSHLTDLMAALMQHAGEISRNGYHCRLPAWMMDNVRRGAEQVGPPGSQAPDYSFALLYRVMRWTQGSLCTAWDGGRFAGLEPVATSLQQAIAPPVK